MLNTKGKYGKKRICPCPKSKKQFCPLLDERGVETSGGKCWSPACGQKYFHAPESVKQHDNNLTFPSRRDHIYVTIDGINHMRITVLKKQDGTKQVYAEHWDGNKWCLGVAGVKRIPYRLPQLLERIALGGPIVIVEGERDADSAAEIGVTATTCPFGAGRWSDENSEYLSGGCIVLLPDNDDIGREHMRSVKKSLEDVGVICAAILELTSLMPDLPIKGDLTDYLKLGGSPELLRNAINDAVQNAIRANSDSLPVPLPTIVWDQLPSPLRELTDCISDERQRIALLMSSIVLIGGVIPKVRTMYHGQSHGPSLYCFIVGPPGSGKSCVSPTQLLLQSIDYEIREKSKREFEKYERELTIWKRQGSKDGDDPPIKPKKKILFVPTDSTGPVLIRAICENESVVLFDNEADSFNTALQPEFGSASPALRKAWQCEPISQARVGNDLHVETDSPHLAIVVTGTPDQVPVLIKHVATGLTSRFCFIEFPKQNEFRDPFVDGSDQVYTLASDYSSSIHGLWNYVKNGSGDDGFRVTLTRSQRERFNQHFSERYQDEIEGADPATTLRSGIVTMRIATVLTALRRWASDGCLTSVMHVDDNDFANSLSLGEFLRQGTDSFVARLTALQPASRFANWKRPTRRWFELLPAAFTTHEAIECGLRVGIAKSTVKNLLKDDLYFEKVRHGNYEKKNMNAARGP